MLLRVIVKPNSKMDEISKDEAGNIKIKIKAPPVDGKANKYLVDFLSKKLKLPKSQINIEKGSTNSFKTIAIDASEAYVLEQLL